MCNQLHETYGNPAVLARGRGTGQELNSGVSLILGNSTRGKLFYEWSGYSIMVGRADRWLDGLRELFAGTCAICGVFLVALKKAPRVLSLLAVDQ